MLRNLIIKNHFLWSTSNEAFYGENITVAYYCLRGGDETDNAGPDKDGPSSRVENVRPDNEGSKVQDLTMTDQLFESLFSLFFYFIARKTHRPYLTLTLLGYKT